MSVYNAHAETQEQLKSYNSINAISNFSIAEFKSSGEMTLDQFEHSHIEYEFLIPLKTIPIIIYDKANYIGEVGYAYPVNPMVNHGIGTPLTDGHCVSITISEEYFNSEKAILGYEDKLFFSRFQISNKFLSTVQKFISEYSKDSSDLTQLETLKKVIVHSLIENGLQNTSDKRRPEKQYRRSIRTISIYMYDNFRDPSLNVEKLAEISGFSSAYFSKSFKAFMGDTPVVHLNRLRISEAKYLLHSLAPYNLSQISEMVGYSNLSTFTEAFKTVTGHTPSEYKKLYIKNKE